MKLRTRHIVLVGGSLAVIAGLFANDPGAGAASLAWLQAQALPLLAVALAFYVAKALHDYPEADQQKLMRSAGQEPLASALVLLYRGIVFAAIVYAFIAPAKAAIPDRAHQHLPTVAAELRQHWPAVPMVEYIPGLIEHESCISLTHSRCWSPTSRLKTPREEGAGLGQLTRAWRPDGSTRFDALAEMQAAHPALRDLSWGNVYSRPDLQIRAVVLKVRGDFGTLRDVTDQLERLAMADAAYNGGIGGLQAERRACRMSPGCDPGRWHGHVERQCLKSRAPLYAGRSACDINRHHVHDVLHNKAPKYRGLVHLGAVG